MKFYWYTIRILIKYLDAWMAFAIKKQAVHLLLNMENKEETIYE